MFKFFRKVRAKLVADGRIKRYTLYALGEILLLMIGILLALQVNNWNERKKIAQSEHAYLKRIHQDMQSMMLQFQYDSLHISDIDDAHGALKYVEQCGENAVYESAFSRTLLSHQVLGGFYPIQGTYDEMISTGAFARLKNDSLKGAISRVYNWIDGSNLRVEYFRKELSGASTTINSMVAFSYDNDRKLVVDYQINKICQNLSFKNALVEVIDTRTDRLQIADRIKFYLRKATDDIELELSKSS